MRITLSVLAMAAAVAAFPAAAENGFLTITAAKQGVIKGEVTRKGYEDSLEVVNLSLGVVSPALQGRVSASRVQEPVVITLRWSKATPLLMTAAANGEVLSSVKYTGVVATPQGVDKQAHTLTLSNARITAWDIKDNNGDAPGLDPLVELTLTYQKLEVTEMDGGITSVDDWSH